MARWSVPLDVFFENVEREITEDVQEIFADFTDYLVDATPFRTGRLKGGYQAALNRDPAFARPPDDKGGENTKALLRAVIAQFKLPDEAKIVNYTPYGPFVNDGTSKQAGQFFVEGALNFISSR